MSACRAVRLALIGVAVSHTAGCASPQNIQPAATAGATSAAETWDCFKAAERDASHSVELRAPEPVIWDRKLRHAVMLSFKLKNLGGVAAVANTRGVANVSPVPGDDEVSLLFLDASGKPWRQEGHVKTIVESEAPTAGDYIEVGPGGEVAVSITVSDYQFPLPTGEYTVHGCYWDRLERHALANPKPALRGPVAAPPFSMTVRAR